MCACGVTRSCASTDLNCNCDVNDDVTRVDDGYIMEKTDLPIRSVHIRKSGQCVTFPVKIRKAYDQTHSVRLEQKSRSKPN